ncbi:MAG: YceH family protein, partial [Acidobacteriota bacterium]|nr:YceH family protein [Acidobacteriota bacterium]
MNIELDEVEARVVGCLIEKEATTPDNYPLTVNALVNACNQKTNRFPVVDYNEETVTNALDSLRDKNVVYVFFGGSSRVAKYKHLFPKILNLSYPEVAALCVLMLRGPQTPGEIKSRAARLYGF